MRRKGLLFGAIVAAVAATAGLAGAVEPGFAINYSAFPDDDPDSGRFVNIVRKTESTGELGIRFTLIVPGEVQQFRVDFFDGDNGGDPEGGVLQGHWDFPQVLSDGLLFSKVVYRLYADPLKLAEAAPAGTPVATWTSDEMSDDAWTSFTVPTSAAAKMATGNFAGQYCYNLVIGFDAVGQDLPGEMSAFKIRADAGILVSKDTSFGIVGYWLNYSATDLRWTTYDGSWRFSVIVPDPASESAESWTGEYLDFWTYDFDYAFDTDDPNSPDFPDFLPAEFRGTVVKAEAANLADPEDGAIFQRIVLPNGLSVVDPDPSASRECEVLRIGTAASDPDEGGEFPELPYGVYLWEIEDAQGANTLFLRPPFDTYSLISEGSIGDRVWEDTDRDGQQDVGEAGIEGVEVRLYWDDEGVGTFDETELQAVMTTGVNGLYSFTYLRAGVYKVVVDTALLEDYDQTYDLDDGWTLPPIAPGSPASAVRVLGTNSVTGKVEHAVDVDFGYTPKIPVSELLELGGRVWRDMNGNQVYASDPLEPPFANVVVQLSGPITATQLTDGNGYFRFTNLVHGTYTITVVSSNFSSGKPLVGLSQTTDWDFRDFTLYGGPFGALNNQTQRTLVTGGPSYLDNDFGYRDTEGPGTGTPGYWMNHPEAWPVDNIVIGGVTYTKDEAIAFIKKPVKGDKRYTMFAALVAAVLNVIVGNDATPIYETIVAADAWMSAHPLKLDGSGDAVKASSSDWKSGEPLASKLDQYNNGLLGVPHRN